jgi:hypothetical protein
VPFFRRAVPEFVSDHEVLHVTLPVRLVRHHLRLGSDPASMDKIDSMDFFAAAPNLILHMEEATWRRQQRPRLVAVPSRLFKK